MTWDAARSRFVRLALAALLLASSACGDAPPATPPAPAPGAPAVRSGATSETPPKRAARLEPGAGDEAPPAPTEAPSDRRNVRGVVRDSDGTPVAGAQVTIHAQAAGRWHGTGLLAPDAAAPLATTTTAEDGTYASVVVAGYSPIVVARKEGFAPAAAIENSQRSTDLVLVAAPLRDLVVTDEAGRAVAGAEIALLGEDAIREILTTDAEGRAQLAAERNAELRIRAAGRATTTWTVPDKPSPLRIVLREGRPLAGVVVDGHGDPLAEVSVLLMKMGPSDPERSAERRRTGPDGAFAFDGLDPASGEFCWVLARGRGWPDASVRATAGETGVRVVMRRPATIRGIVVLPDGRPANGAIVLGRNTGADGRFEITQAEPGQQKLEAFASSPEDPVMQLRGATTVEVSEGGVLENVRITLAPPTSTSYVSVRVLFADGSPYWGEGVTAWQDGEEVGNGSTGRDGTALVIVHLPAGASVDVTASDEDVCARTDKPVVTRAGSPLPTTELQLGPPGVLRLHLVDGDGKEVPLDRAEIMESDADEFHSLADSTLALRTDEPWFARIRVPGFSERRLRFDPPHPALREETVRLEPACRIVGRVIGPDGRPRAGAFVVVRRGEVGWFGRNTADADGRFEIDSSPAGPATLLVIDDDRAVAFLRTFTAASARTDLGDLVLTERRPLRFLVADGAGHPLGGAQAYFRTSADWLAARPTTSRPDGTLDARVAAGVPCRVLVRRPGFATQIVDATADAPQPIRVTLAPGGAVRVRVAATAAPGHRHVEAQLPASPSLSWWPLAPYSDPTDVLASEDGAVFADLPPGPVEIAVVTDRRRLVRTVEVVAGKTVDCVFGE